MKTLLIATDFSENSRQVAAYGYRLAQQIRAKVLLCHALNVPIEIPQTGIVAWPADVYDDITRDGMDELTKIRRCLIAARDQDGYEPEIVCLQHAGFVTDVLSDVAEAYKADLILIGMHGDDAVSSLMIGNHSRKMIESTGRPVLLVPAGISTKPITRIALGIDFKKPEMDAPMFGQLVNFAKELGAELVLAHVNRPDDVPGYMSRGKQLREDLIRQFDYPKISFTVLTNAQVEEGLEWMVSDLSVDMLAMVHREHSFFYSLFKGSFTQKAARHLKVPLLVFKSDKLNDL